MRLARNLGFIAIGALCTINLFLATLNAAAPEIEFWRTHPMQRA